MQHRKVVRDWLAELNRPDLLETKRTISCGSGVHALLRSALSQLQDEAQSSSRVLHIAETLHTLADEQINSVHFQNVDSKWLQLYCDAAILHTAVNLSRSDNGEGVTEEVWKAAVRRLDMAIIVAGAPGAYRQGRIFALMRMVQKLLPGPPNRILYEGSTSIPSPSRKRRRVEPDELSLPLYAPQSIRVLDPPSTSEFTSSLSNEPFIIRGYVQHDSPTCPRWPALERWSSGEYLLRVAGPGRVVPVELGRAYDEALWTQRILPLNEFLGRAGFLDEKEQTGEPMYLAQYDIFRQVPELEKDMAIPDYVWSEPPTPPDYPAYAPPDNVLINVWVGSGSSEIISPPHTDPYFNCYVQVVGRKRVWLAPPGASPHMLAYSVETEDGSTAAKQYMDNTSSVSIFKQPARELWAKHPGFKDRVYPLSVEAVLEPGDMLFMPPGWWHAMRGEGDGPGWSVSMWF